MKIELIYLKKADKFFIKNSHIITKDESKQLVIKALKKIFKNEKSNLDIKRLKGKLKNYYRIRQGKVRILFELVKDKIIIKAIVTDIDFRGSIYK